jgi:hypothetical protein
MQVVSKFWAGGKKLVLQALDGRMLCVLDEEMQNFEDYITRS